VTPLDTGLSPMSKVRSIRLCDRAGQRRDGGAGGIRTLDRALQPYNGLANRRLQPLGHSSMSADMPDAGASRKRQIQITRGRLEAPMLFAYASRTADIPYRAFRRVFPGPTCRYRNRVKLIRGRRWADSIPSTPSRFQAAARKRRSALLHRRIFGPEIGLPVTARRLFALLGRPAGGEAPSRLPPPACAAPHLLSL
jgi:hypothetical protein